MTGIPGDVFPGFAGNRDTQQPDPVDDPTVAEVLRLNYDIPPDTFSPLGLLGGDLTGFPNGRRVGEDTGDIYLKAGAGGILQALGLLDPGTCNPGLDPLSLSDGVQGNDVAYLEEFPYLGRPQEGFDHNHDHGSGLLTTTTVSMGIGSGLIVVAVALGAVFTIRRRRNPLGD